MTEKTILHINNWALTGGVPQFIVNFARTFPEFQHVMCSLNNHEDYALVKYIREQGLKYVQADAITRELIEGIDPKIVILHNIQKEKFAGAYPTDILFDRRKIWYHHNVLNPIPYLLPDLNIYVSEFVKNKSKEEGIIIPPCAYSFDYNNVNRPERDEMVIGRIQSRTCGDITDDFLSLLEGIENTKTFIVSKDRGNPIKPGMMANYLANIDVLAMWSGRVESWSMVTTEAMLSGIPVVAYNRNCGMAEQIKASGGGMLVNSQEEFKNALEKLRDDPELRKTLAQRGKSWALHNSSQHRLRRDLINIFLEWA